MEILPTHCFDLHSEAASCRKKPPNNETTCRRTHSGPAQRKVSRRIVRLGAAVTDNGMISVPGKSSFLTPCRFRKGLRSTPYGRSLSKLRPKAIVTDYFTPRARQQGFVQQSVYFGGDDMHRSIAE